MPPGAGDSEIVFNTPNSTLAPCTYRSDESLSNHSTRQMRARAATGAQQGGGQPMSSAQGYGSAAHMAHLLQPHQQQHSGCAMQPQYHAYGPAAHMGAHPGQQAAAHMHACTMGGVQMAAQQQGGCLQPSYQLKYYAAPPISASPERTAHAGWPLHSGGWCASPQYQQQHHQHNQHQHPHQHQHQQPQQPRPQQPQAQAQPQPQSQLPQQPQQSRLQQPQPQPLPQQQLQSGVFAQPRYGQQQAGYVQQPQAQQPQLQQPRSQPQQQQQRQPHPQPQQPQPQHSQPQPVMASAPVGSAAGGRAAGGAAAGGGPLPQARGSAAAPRQPSAPEAAQSELRPEDAIRALQSLRRSVQDFAHCISLVDAAQLPPGLRHMPPSAGVSVPSGSGVLFACISVPSLGQFELHQALRTIMEALRERPALTHNRTAFICLMQGLVALCNRSHFPALEQLRTVLHAQTDVLERALDYLSFLAFDSLADVMVVQLLAALLLPRDMVDFGSSRSLCQLYRQNALFSKVVVLSLRKLSLPLSEGVQSAGTQLVPFWDAAIGSLPFDKADADRLADSIRLASAEGCMPPMLAFMRFRLESAGKSGSLPQLYKGCAPILRVLANVVKCETSARVIVANPDEGPPLLSALLKLGCEMLRVENSVRDLLAAMTFEVLALAAVHRQLSTQLADDLQAALQPTVEQLSAQAATGSPRPLLPRLTEALCCLYAALQRGSGRSLIAILLVACGGEARKALVLKERLVHAIMPGQHVRKPTANEAQAGKEATPPKGREAPRAHTAGGGDDAREGEREGGGGGRQDVALRKQFMLYQLLEVRRTRRFAGRLPCASTERCLPRAPPARAPRGARAHAHATRSGALHASPAGLPSPPSLSRAPGEPAAGRAGRRLRADRGT